MNENDIQPEGLENEPAPDKEPQEGAIQAADEDVVEIIPDEPSTPGDKGKKVVRSKDNDADVTEEELAQYSEDVRKRINKLSWHKNNERRRAEQAEKDRDEAVRIASMLLEEKRNAEKKTFEVTEAHAKTTAEKIDAEMIAVRKKLAEAAEIFDAEGIAEATAEISRLVVQKERASERAWAEKTTRQTDESQVDSSQVQAQPQRRPDPLAEAWAKKNSWFRLNGSGAPVNEESAFALKVHETLLSNGVHPVLNASDYYRKLDATMRKNFPVLFDDASTGDTEQAPAAQPQRRPSVVSGVSRTPATSNRIRLTESEARIARSMGVTPEEYAKAKLNLSRG